VLHRSTGGHAGRGYSAAPTRRPIACRPGASSGGESDRSDVAIARAAQLRDSREVRSLSTCRLSIVRTQLRPPSIVPHLSNPSRSGSLIGWNSGSHPFDEGLVLIQSWTKIARCGNATFENAMDDARGEAPCLSHKAISPSQVSIPSHLNIADCFLYVN